MYIIVTNSSFILYNDSLNKLRTVNNFNTSKVDMETLLQKSFKKVIVAGVYKDLTGVCKFEASFIVSDITEESVLNHSSDSYKNFLISFSEQIKGVQPKRKPTKLIKELLKDHKVKELIEDMTTELLSSKLTPSHMLLKEIEAEVLNDSNHIS